MNFEFGHWFAGFIDGEGCFSMRKQQGATNAWLCEFGIGLRDDDLAIVQEIQARTGLGKIKPRPPHSASVGNAKPQVYWCIVRRRQCAELCEILDQYPLRSKKARDYVIWREAVLLWNAQSGWKYPDSYSSAMAKLNRRLRTGRLYVPALEAA